MENYTLQGLKACLDKTFDGCEDFVTRPMDGEGFTGACFFIKNICDRAYLGERVIAPILKQGNKDFRGEFSSLLQCAAFNVPDTVDAAAAALLAGNVLVAVETDRLYTAVVAADHFNHRGVDEPDSDVTVKGPKAGFTENGEGNLAAIRRIIRSNDLKTESLLIGELTKTRLFLVYYKGRADMQALADIRRRLKKARPECVVDSGNIEQLLCPKGSFFPSLGSSEKVDKVASKILAGRIAVICDGSPFVLTAPYVFAECIQSAEDYIKPAWYSTFMRFLRFFALLAALLMPAIFTAAVYHDRFLVPSPLMEAIDEMRKDIKLPFIGEMLLMLTAFEIVREVGVRMPRTVGDAVGIVASLLVGDATVEAGLAGTSVLLIVAFSETAGFIVPSLSSALVVMRYLYLFAAYTAGLYGILFALGLTVIGLLRKKSFGASYMSPLVPFSTKGMQDFLLALPKKTLGRREKLK